MKSTCALLFVTACATSPAASDSPGFASVRARLEAEPTKLFVATMLDAGTLDAAHNTGSGWQSGSASLSIASGVFVAALGADGALVASSFDVAFDPIDVPESVFGSPAQLTDVQLQLPAPTSGAARWSDGDDATATLPVALSLSWSLEVNGGTLPLGAQSLPAIPLDLVLSGDGTAVSVALSLHGSGTLWQWADLLELTELDLVANGETTATE